MLPAAFGRKDINKGTRMQSRCASRIDSMYHEVIYDLWNPRNADWHTRCWRIRNISCPVISQRCIYRNEPWEIKLSHKRNALGIYNRVIHFIIDHLLSESYRNQKVTYLCVYLCKVILNVLSLLRIIKRIEGIIPQIFDIFRLWCPNERTLIQKILLCYLTKWKFLP